MRKQGEFYKQLTSAEKRGAWSSNNFKENIQSNMLLRKYYRPKKNILNEDTGKQTSVSSIIQGWKFK